MRLGRTLAALAAVTALTAAPAAAQTLQILPKVGAFSPLSDLGDFNNGTQELKGSLAVGLAAEVKLGVLPRLRVGFDYASDTEVSAKNGIGDRGSAGPTMLALAADIVLPASGAPLSPYLLLGGGIKRYNFTRDDFSDPSIGSVFDANQSDPTGHVGAGLTLGLGAFGLNLEASDYISQFDAPGGESKLQHDLFATLGLRVSLF